MGFQVDPYSQEVKFHRLDVLIFRYLCFTVLEARCLRMKVSKQLVSSEASFLALHMVFSVYTYPWCLLICSNLFLLQKHQTD